jgi:ADP-ribose pyrophosphatase
LEFNYLEFLWIWNFGFWIFKAMPRRLKKLTEETIHANPWWKYKHDTFEKPNGETGDYYYAETGGGVIIIPVLSDGRVVLILQYRYLQDKQGIEFPAGAVKEGEKTVEEIAKAELWEETGCAADNLIKIGTFQPDRGIVKELLHVFVAQVNEDQGKQQLSDTEDIEVMYRRPDEIDDMIKRNDIWDGETMAAWAMARSNFFKNNSYGEQTQ